MYVAETANWNLPNAEKVYGLENRNKKQWYCTALPRVKFLSNPRRMHSKGEEEEKEEQGLQPLFRDPEVIWLNSDGFCDSVQTWMEVIGHF